MLFNALTLFCNYKTVYISLYYLERKKKESCLLLHQSSVLIYLILYFYSMHLLYFVITKVYMSYCITLKEKTKVGYYWTSHKSYFIFILYFVFLFNLLTLFCYCKRVYLHHITLREKQKRWLILHQSSTLIYLILYF